MKKLATSLALTLALITTLGACGSSKDTNKEATEAESTADSQQEASFSGTLKVGAIPDQDPEKLQRTYSLLATYLQNALPGIKAEYVPVTDYQGAIASFKSGDLDLVWFGGLTGVQARLEVEGSQALAQRDIDAKFTSVFIASSASGLGQITDVNGLSEIKGHSLTFGSESSTSGRLMPQYFLSQAGVDIETDLKGQVGFSGAHDKTIELVASGTYEVGALNSQVWDSAVKDGKIDTSKVTEIFRTPTYFDYHWVAQPNLDDKFGAGFHDALLKSLLDLDGSTQQEKDILDLFGAGKFISTDASNYSAIEEVARKIGAIR